jgi:hypothetical protein
VNEKASTLVLANKKKLYVYSWQSPGFVLRKDITLTDTPRSLHFLQHTGALVVGFARQYSLVDLSSSSVSKLADVEREMARMPVCELPPGGGRGAAVLLALGSQVRNRDRCRGRGGERDGDRVKLR